MEIKLQNGSLMITMEAIAEMLGISNKGVDILAEGIVDNAEMITQWKDQFTVSMEKVRPSHVKHMIRNSSVADMNFKLNFIVLFTSVLGGVQKKGTCDLSVLNHINMDTDLSNINWCSYIWRCLKRCKDNWKSTETNSLFVGPLTFLTMMYVDGTICKDFRVGRKRPPTAIWTKELLKERQLAEIKTGGLGKGEIAGAYVEEENDMMKDNLEGFIWKLNNGVECISKERRDVERTIDAAKRMFPGNPVFVELEKRYIESLQYKKEGNDNIGGSSVHIVDETREGEGQEASEQHSEHLLDSPQYNMGPDTQAIIFDSADKVYKEYEHEKMFKDIPSCSLGLTQGVEIGAEFSTPERDMAAVVPNTPEDRVKTRTKPLDVVPLNYYSPKEKVYVRGRRAITLTEKMKSPNFVRVVNIDKPENKDEKRLANIMFSRMNGDDREVLFKTNFGHQATRGEIESLGPQEQVDNNVLSTWSVYLNYMEIHKSTNSPARLFFPTFEVDKMVMKQNNDYKLQKFMEYAEKASSFYGGKEKLVKADLVVIPVSNDTHKFVVCVNLKNPAVSLIDSKKGGDTGKIKKNKEADIDEMKIAALLQQLFGHYLYATDNVKAVDIIGCQMMRGNFSWQTNKRENDSGIFAMRHMECYMGGDMGDWYCGLDDEGKKQSAQLNRLRKKYAAKILLSDCNICKDKIYEEMNSK